MATTITYDSRYNTNKKIASSAARGLKQVTGAINFSGLAYVNGGVTNTFVGFSTLTVVFEQQLGIAFEYDHTNSTIILTVPGAASATATILATADGSRSLEIPSDTSLDAFTAVRFFAVGI